MLHAEIPDVFSAGLSSACCYAWVSASEMCSHANVKAGGDRSSAEFVTLLTFGGGLEESDR